MFVFLAVEIAYERKVANVLFIEANYDLNLLQQDTRRPWSIKQRIMSRHGHLSNTATAEAVRNLADNSLRYVMLGHLSQDCNTPEIAQQTVTTELEQAGIDCIQINVSTQSKPSPTLTI